MGLMHNSTRHQHRRNVHGSKLLLYIWWDQLDVVYYVAAQTERNHHARSLSTTIYVFDLSIEGKTAGI